MRTKQFIIRTIYSVTFLIAVTLLWSCSEKEARQITIKNTLDIARSFETVSIELAALGLNTPEVIRKGVLVRDGNTQKEIISQTIDSDGDGTIDALIFQPEIDADSEKTFEVMPTDQVSATDSLLRCYSRFVPERTDDYAWENNRVAFRTYGPTAQKMVEDGVKGGTLTSGIDAWLKRVDYLIIDKWYKKTTSGEGTYHQDTGEGLDNFHVGVSRGVGGIAKKVDSIYYTSKNFTSWKTLHTGPIRTSFVLTYEDWDASGNKISEEKTISLDYGSNLAKFKVGIRGTDTISAGLTLHENEGEIKVDQKNGWVSYWEPHEDSELGTGIVVPDGNLTGHEYYVTDQKDLSNLFAQIKLNQHSEAIYYAGFGWKKSGQYETKEEWNAYLRDFSLSLKNPLLIEVK